MIDSVFHPHIAHYVESPEIALELIEANLDAIEKRTARALNRALEDAVNELVTRAESFLLSGDAAAIASMSWFLQSNLQLALVAEWEQGWFAGSEDAIEEMKASLPEAPTAGNS